MHGYTRQKLEAKCRTLPTTQICKNNRVTQATTSKSNVHNQCMRAQDLLKVNSFCCMFAIVSRK